MSISISFWKCFFLSLKYTNSKYIGGQTLLNFQNICFSYENSKSNIIDNLSFSIKKGEFVSILGPSGCGKSTIFRLINKLENPQFGKIEISSNCSYMPQKDLFMPWRTIYQNMSLPLEIQKIDSGKIKRLTNETIRLTGLDGFEDSYPRDLSGGMRQRASFGRTLLAGGDIMLLDEPFCALDYITRISMQEWIISRWRQLEKTILFITHDIDEAILLSQRILVLGSKPVSEVFELNIGLSYPRTRKMLESKEVQNIREILYEKLKLEISI